MTNDQKEQYFSHYVLNESGEAVVENDLYKWGMAMEKDRRLFVTDIGELTVSTVFLGLDHGFGVGEKPVLWETIIFGLPKDSEDCMWRYDSPEKAKIGHVRAVEIAKFTLLNKVSLDVTHS